MVKDTSSYSLSRRDFLVTAAAATTAGATCGALRAAVLSTPELRKAMFYKTLDRGNIQCTLCPWNCIVPPGQQGRCGVRENRQGRYYTLVYGRPCSRNNDPIEKKPFFHVYPRSMAFSIATVGCNLTCKFCQNWEISQASPDQITVPFMSPRQIVKLALAQKIKPRSIAYTYSEPTIFYEYMTDCARAARDAGLANVVVSNGFIAEQPLKELCKLITAMKVDLKSFSQEFYGEVCNGRLTPVLNTLKRLSDSGVWFEIVVLLIPTLNDNTDEIKRMADWIVKELGPNVPIHFTRFHPMYRLRNLPRTPTKTLERARQAAMQQGCNFVYGGNVPGMLGENTYCPHCKTLLVDRHGHTVISNTLAEGKCHKCSTAIPGVWA